MNSFGRIFRISILGESHGSSVGVLLDGCPPGLPLDPEDFLIDLQRRRGGDVPGITPRREADEPRIQSGIYQGHTSGAPILILFDNQRQDSSAYEHFGHIPRPGHADFVALKKYGGHGDLRGGGSFSGRLTVGLVAAGVVAKKFLAPIQIQAQLCEVGGNPDIQQAVAEALIAGDSVGGLVECRVSGLPVGLGEPFFDSLESLLAHGLFSIPGIKGVEFGDGFEACSMRGSHFNDPIVDISGRTSSNHSGGINGGLSNGNEVLFRVAVKPTSSIRIPQTTLDLHTGRLTSLSIHGRHDACIALRMPVIVEAVAAAVIMDLQLMHQTTHGRFRLRGCLPG